MDDIRISIDDERLNQLLARYGETLTQKALQLTRTYQAKLQRDAQLIISDAGHVDTGRLVNAIKQKTETKDGKIVGEVYAGTDYARFIHEGAKHEGEQIKPHFVSFAAAPSLLLWAKRNKVIYQKQDDGRLRRRAKAGARWYMMNAKGKEYPIDLEKGGLMVKQEAVKYLTVPFSRLAPEYLARMQELTAEG